MQRDTLSRCIFESLSLFGENSKAALLTHFQKEGIEFTPDKFDIDKFCMATQKMLGQSADFIFVKIIDEFCRQSNTTLEEIGISGRARYLTQSGILVSLFSKVKEAS